MSLQARGVLICFLTKIVLGLKCAACPYYDIFSHINLQ